MREVQFNLAKVDNLNSMENVELLDNQNLKDPILEKLTMWKDIFTETNIVIRLF